MPNESLRSVKHAKVLKDINDFSLIVGNIYVMSIVCRLTLKSTGWVSRSKFGFAGLQKTRNRPNQRDVSI